MGPQGGWLHRGCNNLLGEASKSDLKLANLQGLVALASRYGGDRGRGAVGQHPHGYHPHGYHPLGTTHPRGHPGAEAARRDLKAPRPPR